MLFFRQIQHLLPRATAWRLTVDKTLRRLLVGMSEANSDVRDFIDALWFDLFPTTTRELGRWERQFGLTGTGTESERRLVYAATWAAQGGQSPRYLQDVIQAAGFPVYVHEWWWTVPVYRAQGVVLVTYSAGPPFVGGETVLVGSGGAQREFKVTDVVASVPGQQNITVTALGPLVDASWQFPSGSTAFVAPDLTPGTYANPAFIASGGITRDTMGAPVARDPRDYTFYPQIGSVQCDGQYAHCTAVDAAPPSPLPGTATLEDVYPQCNRFLMNDPGYLVNRNLTRDAPPPVPTDRDAHPYFLYIGGATFGGRVSIAPERREEFERLLLKLRPQQQWIVTLIDYA